MKSPVGNRGREQPLRHSAPISLAGALRSLDNCRFFCETCQRTQTVREVLSVKQVTKGVSYTAELQCGHPREIVINIVKKKSFVKPSGETAVGLTDDEIESGAKERAALQEEMRRAGTL